MAFHHNKVFKYIDLQFITKIRTQKVKIKLKRRPPQNIITTINLINAIPRLTSSTNKNYFYNLIIN